jgi:cyanophycinase
MTYAFRTLLLLTIASPLAAQSNLPRPRLVIVGGALADENQAIYDEIVRGRQGNGPLCVLPTASGVAEGATRNAVEAITRYSGTTAVVGIPLTTENAKDADNPEMASRLRACSGYFFTGGDQSRIVRVFKPAGRTTAALDAVMARHREGAVISGSSAGAGMMSDPMIAGGNSAPALANGIARDTGDARGVTIAPGIGFFKQAIVDQHFLARGRIARLIVATLGLPESRLGFGIDENTALIVGDNEAWVAGASAVILVDASKAARQNGSQGGTGLRFALLSAGDRYRFGDGTLTFAPAKTAVAATGAAPAQVADMFARRAFQTWLTALARTSSRAGSFTAGGYRFDFSPMQGFDVRATGETQLSAGPWKLDLVKAN